MWKAIAAISVGASLGALLRWWLGITLNPHFPAIPPGTLAANLIFNSWISDMMTGHKAMRTELFRDLRLRERGFAIEAEITARLLQHGVRIYEVPIDYVARGREEGKKLTAMDGVRVLVTLLRCRLS